MTARVEAMNGEELLLMRILGDPQIQPIIAGELDRRALLGKRKFRWSAGRNNVALARNNGLLVA